MQHAASQFGHIQIVKQLIARGADVNQKCPKKGNTPLHYAAESNRLEIVETLLRAGADRKIRNKANLRPSKVVTSVNPGNTIDFSYQTT